MWFVLKIWVWFVYGSYICILAIVILYNFNFNEILSKHNGIPLGAHFTYWNSVIYWPEDGLR